MAVRPVLQFPDKRLRVRSQPVDAGSAGDALRALARDMLETMYDEPGIGLAAPQVGEPVRLIVMDTGWTEDGAERSPIVALNPEILARDGQITWTEGCLSVPDFTADVERSARVTVRFVDLDGVEHKEEAEGLRAVCFQHEIDHLDGLLFIDRISRLKRELYERRRRKALRRGLEDEGDGGAPAPGSTL
jgi:peptide deformylase